MSLTRVHKRRGKHVFNLLKQILATHDYIIPILHYLWTNQMQRSLWVCYQKQDYFHYVHQYIEDSEEDLELIIRIDTYSSVNNCSIRMPTSFYK